MQKKIMNKTQRKRIKAPKPNEVSVVMAVNASFIPILSVCLHSVREHVRKDRTYTIYVLHQDISEIKRKRLSMELERDNFEIVFIDVSARVAGYRLRGKNHISSETYYRFLIMDIFAKQEKVLYLDCDVIVRHDLADLFLFDIGEKWIGAVPDLDFIGQCSGANPDTMSYADRVLKMDNPLSYFQAGVLIFNVPQLRRHLKVKKLLNMAQDPKYMYSDQDILNILCEGKKCTLPIKWNVLTNCGDRISKVISHAPKHFLKEYEEARKDPWIIHYAGADKPWKNPDGDYAEEFWRIARKSDYYECLLKMLVNDNKQKTVGTYAVDAARMVSKAVLPEGSWIRRKVGEIYWKLR